MFKIIKRKEGKDGNMHSISTHKDQAGIRGKMIFQYSDSYFKKNILLIIYLNHPN